MLFPKKVCLALTILFFGDGRVISGKGQPFGSKRAGTRGGVLMIGAPAKKSRVWVVLLQKADVVQIWTFGV